MDRPTCSPEHREGYGRTTVGGHCAPGLSSTRLGRPGSLRRAPVMVAFFGREGEQARVQFISFVSGTRTITAVARLGHEKNHITSPAGINKVSNTHLSSGETSTHVRTHALSFVQVHQRAQTNQRVNRARKKKLARISHDCDQQRRLLSPAS